MEKLIKELYNSNIGLILDGTKLDEQEELKKSYLKYLKESYIEALANVLDTEKAIIVLNNVEKSKWQNEDKESKQSLLIRDEELDKIKDICVIADEYASKRRQLDNNEIKYDPLITKDEVDLKIKQMINLSKNVRNFNKDYASFLIEKGTLNFMYAANLIDNNSFIVKK